MYTSMSFYGPTILTQYSGNHYSGTCFFFERSWCIVQPNCFFKAFHVFVVPPQKLLWSEIVTNLITVGTKYYITDNH